MWIKECPICNGTASTGSDPYRVPCVTCNGTGAIPSNDPQDQYNELVIDNGGVAHVQNVLLEQI